MKRIRRETQKDKRETHTESVCEREKSGKESGRKIYLQKDRWRKSVG